MSRRAVAPSPPQSTLGPLLVKLLEDPLSSRSLLVPHSAPKQALSGPHDLRGLRGQCHVLLTLVRAPVLRTSAARLLPPTPTRTKTKPEPGMGLRARCLLCGVFRCRSSQPLHLQHSNVA
ncbi:hypothetical protein NDU88_000776 [Pleurodeles waltl]|uniref:Uncharacterized protein n=1 Tax=Pleurodeles waltl TaxID=8319 RepID=A0AAV7Q254_PLEWA|nr:hypothetical protein NDU88_000776 [Pleurodeles waltl]